ncbi:MAG: hypothetical protein RL701_2456, partial [Pseudomonadota bacterium]
FDSGPQPPHNADASGLSRGLARALRPFAKVEAREAISASLLTLAVFLLLLAYYLLKTAREPLILLQGGAAMKTYTAAGQSLLLLGVIPAYAALARRVGRLRLLLTIYGFFALNLLVFVLLVQRQIQVGIAFYLWVGIFNTTAIAQLWSFANDVYTPEQGQRLFAILGIGSSVGAVAGAFTAKRLATAGFGPETLMLGAALLLGVCATLVMLVDRRDKQAPQASSADTAPNPAQQERPPIEGPVVQALIRDKYLLWIALATFILNSVNSLGEYLLDNSLLHALASEGITTRAAASLEIARFKGDFFWIVNSVGVGLQLFAVSRIIRAVGVRRALFVLPVVAFASYSMMLFTPALALIRLGKIAENSLDYSLQNTTRQTLFLIGSRTEKYLGKTVIDSLIVRMGDMFAAVVVYAAGRFALPTSYLAILNLGLIVCWLLVLVALGREHMQRSRGLGIVNDHEA